MAKVTRDVSARSYIATETFNTDFFTYKLTTVNFKTTGALSLVTADPSKCPAGRVLRENGRKLAPGINPGVTAYMVGVYDNQSMLNGFIDPNGPVFAVYSNERPNFLVDNVEPDANIVTDKSAPVLTNGLVSAGTTVTAGLSVTAGTFVSAGTSVTAGTTVRAQKYLTLPVGSGNGTSLVPLTASAGSSAFNGATTALQVIYTTQVTGSSQVFITVNHATPRAVSAVPNAGFFTVYSSAASDTSTFYWLVLN